MPDLHGDELVLPLLHLLLEWFDVGGAVHRLRLQDVVVQHHLQQADHMITVNLYTVIRIHLSRSITSNVNDHQRSTNSRCFYRLKRFIACGGLLHAASKSLNVFR
jgi:hypothetical protein